VAVTDSRSDQESSLDLRLDEAHRELDELRRRLSALDTVAAATGAASVAVLAFGSAGFFAAASTEDLTLADYRVGYVAAGVGGALLFWSLLQSAIARIGAEDIPAGAEDVPGSHIEDQQLSPDELRSRLIALHLRRIIGIGWLLRSKQRSLLVSTMLLILGAFLVSGSVLSLALAS
jgi:hypothetical protein